MEQRERDSPPPPPPPPPPPSAVSKGGVVATQVAESPSAAVAVPLALPGALLVKPPGRQPQDPPRLDHQPA